MNARWPSFVFSLICGFMVALGVIQLSHKNFIWAVIDFGFAAHSGINSLVYAMRELRR